MQEIDGFAAGTSKYLVNRRSNKLVNIQSTKMMKKHFAKMLLKRGAGPSHPIAASRLLGRPYR